MTPFSYEATDDPKKDRYLFQGTAEEDQNHEKLFNDMVLSLFELPVYQNKKLLNYSLVMLRGIFEQRRDLLKNMKSMIICGKGNLEEVYVTLKSMRGKFSMLSNRGIVHY